MISLPAKKYADLVWDCDDDACLDCEASKLESARDLDKAVAEERAAVDHLIAAAKRARDALRDSEIYVDVDGPIAEIRAKRGW